MKKNTLDFQKRYTNLFRTQNVTPYTRQDNVGRVRSFFINFMKCKIRANYFKTFLAERKIKLRKHKSNITENWALLFARGSIYSWVFRRISCENRMEDKNKIQIHYWKIICKHASIIYHRAKLFAFECWVYHNLSLECFL